MKLYAMKNETELLTEKEFYNRVASWRDANVLKLYNTRSILNAIKIQYLDEGVCYKESNDDVWGDLWVFTSNDEAAIDASAIRWLYQIFDDPMKIVIYASNEDEAKKRLRTKFENYFHEIDTEIEKWEHRLPDHQEFSFDESKIQTNGPEPFSSLEALEEAVKNR